MQRYKLTIEYDGRPFCGWQKQDGILSVQQAVEEAFFKFCGEKVETVVAGRTDAGVHAMGQVCHADIARPTSAEEVVRALNAHLRPLPVAIINAAAVENDFSARFSAKRRAYMYRICNRRVPLALEQGTVWQVATPLDIERMNEGAKYLTGIKTDFSAFRSSQCQAKNPVRTIDDIHFSVIPDYRSGGGCEIRMHIEALSFLHHQVRNIIGTLKKVGEGTWAPEKVKEILESCDRSKAGETAPPDGLYFTRVDY